MIQDTICSFSWTAIAALAAVVTAVIVFWQVRQEGQLNRLTMGVDALLRLSDQWDSPRMVRKRRRAAKALLDDKPNRDVDDLLDWFETVALLVRRGGFDDEFTWSTFYLWMSNYWCAAKTYIEEVRRDEGSATWKDFCDVLMPRLFAIEAGSDNCTLGEIYPSMTEVREFLEDESRLTEPRVAG